MSIALVGLLAIQISTQPLLVRTFIPGDAINSACILLSEILKVIACGTIYLSGESGHRKGHRWSLSASILTAFPPAVIYAFQNVAITLAQQNLDGFTYNILNQSKLLSAAVLGYFILGRLQSARQVFSLFLLSLASVMAVSGSSETGENITTTFGIVAALVASGLSGLSGSLSDMALQKRRRNSFLFSLELSVYVIVTMIFGYLLDHFVAGPDSDISRIIHKGGLLHAAGIRSGLFSPALVPIISAAIGGILVGQVTRLVGSVRKGFAVSTGVVLTALIDNSSRDIWSNWQLLLSVPLALAAVTVHGLEQEKLKNN